MIDPAQVHLQAVDRARKALALLASDPAKRAYVPMNYRVYLRSASGYSLRTSIGTAGYVEQLGKFQPIEILLALLEIIESAELPSLFTNYSADDVDILAIPLLLGRRDLAQRYLEGFLLKGSSSRFWESYVLGLRASYYRTPFEASLPSKLRGMEKHWSLYLRFMGSVAKGDLDDNEVASAIGSSFERCNSDKRLTEVTHIDPNGTYPVPWDIRQAYVLSAGSSGPN